MYLPANSRVITIGDGDLSFSRALLSHVAPQNLIATTYDSADDIHNKYRQNALNDLLKAGVKVENGIDITSTEKLDRIPWHQADIIIFNHPLVPTQRSYAQYQKDKDKSANLMNRHLLFHFLKHSFEYLLAPEGQRLCYITTKSVKPYSHWHLETSLTINTPYQYLGNEPFEATLFKNYLIRNVDRDKCVKHDASDIYVYSDKLEHPITSRLNSFNYNTAVHCPLCRKGPFANSADLHLHQQTRIHKAQQQYHEAWLAYLGQQMAI